MNCDCEKAPEFPTKAFIPGPIEIPINFRAVTIPADQGDDTTNPPLNGAYRNVVLKYAANNHVYIYSSDGIPVMLVGGIDFDEIANRPLYDGEPITSDTNIPDLTDEIETLEAQIQALATDFSYKGSVEDYAHLPSDAAVGDVYTTTDTGIIYVWDGNAWVALNKYPSVFTGTDGVTAGTDGLVPAPAVADAGKVLGADGNWVDAASTTIAYIKLADFVAAYFHLYKDVSLTNYYTYDEVVSLYTNGTLIFRIVDAVSYSTPADLDRYARDSLVVGKFWDGDPSSFCFETFYDSPLTGVTSNKMTKFDIFCANRESGESDENTYFAYFVNLIEKDLPIIVQTTGTSTTSVMSQKATTDMVYQDGNSRAKIRLGYNAVANGASSVSIGPNSYAGASGSVAIGAYSRSNTNGVMDIGSTSTSYGYGSSNYRLLTGLYDPQNAHDAATKGYVDTAVSGAVSTINSTDWSNLWQ